jgi:ADP-ribose pyrophosphatase YjhB (NUDIX family)
MKVHQMSEEKIVVCVDGVYVKDGKIFLLKRNVEPFKGCWHLPGGHLERNESLEDALIREFKEETNLDINVGRIVDGRIEKTYDRTKIIVALQVTSATGEIRLNSENSKYGWFFQTPKDSVCDYSKYLPAF